MVDKIIKPNVSEITKPAVAKVVKPGVGQITKPNVAKVIKNITIFPMSWNVSEASLDLTISDNTNVNVATRTATDPNGGTLSYSFVGVVPTGFTINSATGVISYTRQYLISNSSYSFTLRAASTSGATAITRPVSLTITSIPTEYTLIASTGSVDEGSAVSFTFTTNGPDGTYYWTNSGTTIASDFTDTMMSGTFAITNGTGSVSRSLLSDETTEGTETVVMEIRSGSYVGSILVNSSITVNDTSLDIGNYILTQLSEQLITQGGDYIIFS